MGAGAWVFGYYRLLQYTHTWQVTDVLEFLRPSEIHPLRFLHTFEASGFRHLYLTEATPPSPSSGEWQALMPLPRAEWHSQALTAGSWVVFGSHVSTYSCFT